MIFPFSLAKIFRGLCLRFGGGGEGLAWYSGRKLMKVGLRWNQGC